MASGPSGVTGVRAVRPVVRERERKPDHATILLLPVTVSIALAVRSSYKNANLQCVVSHLMK